MVMNSNKIKLVAFDLDGTILPSGGKPGGPDLNMLQEIGGNGVYRVMATGRSLFSLRKVISSDFPVDYVIFSSGAGILNWQTGEIFASSSLKAGEIDHLFNLFIDNQLDFMVHNPVPDNHNFRYYFSGERDNPDFERRTDIYKPYSRRILCNKGLPSEAAQFLAVIPPDNVEDFVSVKSVCNGFSVIRATSPLDGESIWMEVFPPEVSKGRKLELLCDMLEVERRETVGVGNDYNDLDMLEWVAAAFVVNNSPDELKERFAVTGSVYDCGFSQAMAPFVSGQKDS